MKRLLLVGLVVAAAVAGGGLIAVWDDTTPDRTSAAFLYVAQIDEPGDTDGAVIEYETLTAAQQTVFERAVADEFTEIPDDTNSSVWYDSDAVRYQNGTYRLTVAET